MGLISDIILKNAEALLSAFKRIDFQKVLSHDVLEVEKLKDVLNSLQIAFKRPTEPLDYYTSNANASDQNLLPLNSVTELEATDQSSQLNSPFKSKDDIISALAVAGFADRVGLVYSSFSDSRTLDFTQTQHCRGLPSFEVVVAPDFAPVSGVHGVFISTTDIMSIIIPADHVDGDWQILKRKSFTNRKAMMDFLSLVLTGFDLP